MNATGRDEIVFLERKSLRGVKVLEDSYQFNERRGWAWIQRVCFWLLKKIGANACMETETVYRAPIDGRGLVERIFKMRSGLAEEFNRGPDLLLIGASNYQELMGGDEMRESVRFGSTYGYSDGRGHRLMDLRVVVIPWMKGALALRDSDILP